MLDCNDPNQGVNHDSVSATMDAIRSEKICSEDPASVAPVLAAAWVSPPSTAADGAPAAAPAAGEASQPSASAGCCVRVRMRTSAYLGERGRQASKTVRFSTMCPFTVL